MTPEELDKLSEEAWNESKFDNFTGLEYEPFIAGFKAAQSHYEAEAIEREKTNTQLTTELVELTQVEEQERRLFRIKIAALEKRVERLIGTLAMYKDQEAVVWVNETSSFRGYFAKEVLEYLKQDEDKSDAT